MDGNEGLQRRRHWLAAAPLLAALLGCAAQQDVSVRLETGQQFAPSTIVEVLPALPPGGYVRIAVLDAQGAAGTPLAQLLAQLQSKAQSLGANAMVVENLSQRTQGSVQFNPSGGQFSVTAGSEIPHLRAVAIRLEKTP